MSARNRAARPFSGPQSHPLVPETAPVQPTSAAASRPEFPGESYPLHNRTAANPQVIGRTLTPLQIDLPPPKVRHRRKLYASTVLADQLKSIGEPFVRSLIFGAIPSGDPVARQTHNPPNAPTNERARMFIAVRWEGWVKMSLAPSLSITHLPPEDRRGGLRRQHHIIR